MNYTRNELFSIAKRYNNLKRTYLIVNKKQAKYLPSKPSETFAMTNALAQKMWKAGVKDENTLVIGFAETATALGRLIADHFSQAFYLTTTREEITGKCIEFKEEHSYVVEQRIAIEALSKSRSFSQVIFVDDEFTTGRTLRNLAKELLKEVPSLRNSKKFAVTIIDRTNEENKAKLKELGIEIADNFSKVKIVRMKGDSVLCEYAGVKYLFNEKEKEITPQEEIKEIVKVQGLPSAKHCKPSIGEATRVLLRREPWKILISDKAENLEDVKLLCALAKEKGIPIESYPLKNYKAVGLIKVLH